MMKLSNLFNLLTLLIAMSVLFTSCQEDENEVVPVPQPEPEPEELPITTVDLSSKISIKGTGVEKIMGTPPVPNAETHYTVEGGEQIKAYQSYGFDIVLDSEEDIKGVYIQFVDADGNPADNYFKVPKEAFNPENTETELPEEIKLLTSSIKGLEGQYNMGNPIIVDVDFLNSLNVPGDFCFYICPYYDDAGTLISYSSYVCVEVLAWGGDPLIHGTWQHYNELNSPPGTTTIHCSNGSTLTPLTNVEANEDNVTFNNDGTITWESNGITKKLNVAASEIACAAVYDIEVHYRRTWTGGYSYDITAGELTFIAFNEVSEVVINNTGQNWSDWNYTYPTPFGDVFLADHGPTTITGTGIAGDMMEMAWGAIGGSITFVRQ